MLFVRRRKNTAICGKLCAASLYPKRAARPRRSGKRVDLSATSVVHHERVKKEKRGYDVFPRTKIYSKTITNGQSEETNKVLIT